MDRMNGCMDRVNGYIKIGLMDTLDFDLIFLCPSLVLLLLLIGVVTTRYNIWCNDDIINSIFRSLVNIRNYQENIDDNIIIVAMKVVISHLIVRRYIPYDVIMMSLFIVVIWWIIWQRKVERKSDCIFISWISRSLLLNRLIKW